MIAFYYAHRAGKSILGQQTGFNGISADKAHAQVLGVEVFFIVGIQNSKRDAVGGADTDGVGNLPGIHMQKHAEAWRNGDAAPDVKGESFWGIPEDTAYSIGKATAEFVGEDHGCKKIFTACMFAFCNREDGRHRVGVVSSASAQVIVAQRMYQKDVGQRSIASGSFHAGSQNGSFFGAAPSFYGFGETGKTVTVQCTDHDANTVKQNGFCKMNHFLRKHIIGKFFSKQSVLVGNRIFVGFIQSCKADVTFGSAHK